MKLSTLLSAVAVSALVSAGVAQAATEVEVRDVAARVIVIPEDRADTDLKVRYGKQGLPTVMVRTQGSKLIADGKLKSRRLSCEDNGSVQISGIGTYTSAELPVITVRVPKNARVSVGGAAFGEIGRSDSLSFSHGGCGSWKVGSTSGALRINIGGSGDVAAINAGDAEINIGGSGSVSLRAVTALEANIGGNGDVRADRVEGPIEVNIGGSGDVAVTDGNTPNLKVSVAGSGDVRFGGTARDLDVSIIGSGNVRVRTVTGKVSKSIMGSGNILIGQ